MPALDLTRALQLGHMGHEVAQVGHLGQTVWTAAAASPVISIASGSGYAGSVYVSTVAGQWYADDVAISGETGSTLTMTSAYEGAAIRCGASNVIRMWTPAALDSSYRTNGVWLDPKRSQTVAGGRVTALADGFGVRDFSQSTATLQPFSATVDGYPALHYDQSALLGLRPDSAFAPVWWSIVATYGTGVETTFSNWANLVSTATTAQQIVGAKGSAYVVFDTNHIYTNGSPIASQATVLPMLRTIFSALPKGTGSSGVWQLGRSESTDRNKGWRGDIFEALALGAEPDTPTRQLIEGYQAHRNGRADALPTDHPYRINAPRIA